MSIEAKTVFLRGWILRKNVTKQSDVFNIYRSSQFHDLKNRKMVEIELFCREITKTLELLTDLTWDQLDYEIQNYIRSVFIFPKSHLFETTVYTILKSV